MAWLVVNPDGKFKIFNLPPNRYKEAITKKADYLEEDMHGHYFHPDVPTGEYREFWGRTYYSAHSLYMSYDKGIDINKNSLSNELYKLTWNDEPIEI